ncbi:hypothetical protein QQX98_011596 [Neonectria punicea]|uniref:Protein SSH4 n=1 Tax=Neonectria punicea TaxID=979145 RepID=A0ABR1GLP1_9HYPO
MTDSPETDERGNEGRRYRQVRVSVVNVIIYFVGFPTVDTDSEETIPTVQMARKLIPEAHVLQHDIFCTSPDGQDHPRAAATGGSPTSKTDVPAHGFFSPAWIQSEALDLLGRIGQGTPTDHGECRNKVLLAGYGFGGIIVKQAVIIANTLPHFHDVAYNIANLGFFATPHRATGRLAWEEILFSMIRTTKMSYRGRLSRLLSDLVECVSELSHVFYQFATKYPTTNFICSVVKAGSDAACETEMHIFDNDAEKVVVWPTTSYDGFALCSINHAEKLRSLREHFAPCHMISYPEEAGNDKDVRHASEKDMMDAYFETLQCVSPSRWILYEPRVFDKSDEYYDMRDIYCSLFQDIPFRNIRGGSIQVTGPSGHGKSAIVKLLSQKISRASSVVIIENALGSVGRYPWSLYGVYVSFIRQIISQRPSLFRPIRGLMSQILRQNVWNEEIVASILSSILCLSQSVDYLVVVYDFESWPSEIQSWWSRMHHFLPKSGGSTCTFLTSSLEPLSELTNAKVHQIDVASGYEKYRNALIKTMTTELFDHGSGPMVLGGSLSNNIRERIASSAKSYEGSISSLNEHLLRLFQTFSTSSFPTIEQSISRAPVSEHQLYLDCIELIKNKPPAVLRWSRLVISWMLLSVRSMRVEELAVVAAISMPLSTVAEMQATIPLDMERDIRNQLGGLVAIEGRHARIISPVAREMLSDERVQSELSLETDNGITRHCLQYLSLILGDNGKNSDGPAIWENCLSQVSYKHQKRSPRNLALELLDYACRFWPTHFKEATDQEGSLKEQVAGFFRDSRISERWFYLHLLSNAALPIGLPEQPSPAQMAGHVGLESIVSSFDASDEAAIKRRVVRIRRGFAEHDAVFLETSLGYYLDCVIANGDEDVAKELLSMDKDRTNEMFPLHRAALLGRLTIVQLLFDLVDDPARADCEDRTPLHMAATGGHADIVRFLIGNSIDCPRIQPRESRMARGINSQDTHLQTPLILATRLGNVDAALVLAESGADMTLQDESGKTAMHYAVLHSPQLVEAFVARDEKSVYIHDNDGCVPAHIAAQAGNAKSATILVDTARASGRLPELLGICNASKKTPLHCAAENGYAEVAEILAQAASTEGIDNNNNSAILAARHGHSAALLAITKGDFENRECLLAEAAGAGQLFIVEYLLHNNVSPNCKSQDSVPALASASANGRIEVVRALLRANADINLTDADRATPLHHAARHGMYDVMLILLNYRSGTGQKVNLEAPGFSSHTPLHYAAEKGHVQAVELLLKSDACVDARSSWKKTPLHLAFQRPEVVRVLLNAGANVNAADACWQTPLHKAAQQQCLESIKLLVEGGANVETYDHEGQSPVTHAISQNNLRMLNELYRDDLENRLPELAAWKNLELAVKSSALDVLKLLMSASKDVVTETNFRGRTLLHIAAQHPNVDVVTLLLECGLDVNLPGYYARTPLYEAVRAGNVENMRRLLEWGAEVDKTDNASITPLYTAAERGDVEAISVLLDAKADIDRGCKNGRRTPLWIAANSRKLKAAKRLLDAGANVNVATGGGWAPLHACAHDLNMMRLLVAFLANVNLEKDDGCTPLHVSASSGNPHGVTFLLEKGADPDIVNSNRQTPLHVALKNGKNTAADALLNHDKPFGLNGLDDDGMAPIHWAVKMDEVGLVTSLIEKGADVTTNMANGTSCLTMAIDQGLVEIVSMLLGVEAAPNASVWRREQLVSAYWQAIRMDALKDGGKEQWDIIELLATRDKTLLKEVSEGCNGLETFLCREELRDEADLMAARMVKLGIDPFERRESEEKSGEKSAFELAITSRKKLPTEFFDACLRFLREDTRTLRDMWLKDLRMATELNMGNLCRRLERRMRLTSRAETDEDGWSMDHVYYQASLELGQGSSQEAYQNIQESRPAKDVADWKSYVKTFR